MSHRIARKWLRRFAAEGEAGLLDRRLRALHCPQRSDAGKSARHGSALRTQRLTNVWIDKRVGLPISTEARACQATDVARLPPYKNTACASLQVQDRRQVATPRHQAADLRSYQTGHGAINEINCIYIATPRILTQSKSLKFYRRDLK
ncbi:hypothetical protein [Vandammella animalimorsus]|uniref:hypothetical protein n=1 Tax=Vandammella animalimorsus TaxID=2029117 RepID=UPI003D18CBF2